MKSYTVKPPKSMPNIDKKYESMIKKSSAPGLSKGLPKGVVGGKSKLGKGSDSGCM